MAIKVGINGFGRIGRNIMRAAMADKNIEIVAVNDLTSAATLAHLLKYDSILGRLDADVSATDDAIIVGDTTIRALAERDPNAPVLSLPPTGRVARPDDIARLALFFASEASDHITGQAWNVDGGSAMH